METKWFFAKDNSEKDNLSDNYSEIFRNNGDSHEAFKSIAREAIQNSIDAKQDGITSPLMVRFELIKINRNEFPDINGLMDHIDGTIKFCENKGKQNIALTNSKKQKKLLQGNQFTLLKISDFNTKGVSGSQDLDSGKSKWKGLIYNDGDTIKDSATSLGSHGLGKNASYAISTLRTVFYVTRDLDNNYAMEGVAKLYTSYDSNNIKRVSEGYFCNLNNDKSSPLSVNDISGLSPIFKRNERGTDVFIFEPNISLISEECVKWYLIESVISNFFMAFENGELEVQVDDITIGSNNYRNVFKSLLNYYDEKSEPISSKLISIGQYFQALDDGDDYSDELSGYGEIFLKLFKSQNIQYKKIAIFREHGMLIKDYDVPSANQKFSGVLIVKGKEGIKFLKAIEDPTHSDFDPSREIEDSSMSASEKKKKLNDFYDWIKAKAKSFTKIDTDGSLSLSGMEDYIQMPEDGIGVNKQKESIKIKQLKRNGKKEIERLFENAKASEKEGGADTPSIDHEPGSITPPNPNDYEPENGATRGKDESSNKKGLVKYYSASFTCGPVMKIDDFALTIIFNTNVDNKMLKLKLVAVGEDGKENNFMPKIKDAFDINNDTLLDIKYGVIQNISSIGMAKIRIRFEDKIMSRLKAYVYWEEEVKWKDQLI